MRSTRSNKYRTDLVIAAINYSGFYMLFRSLVDGDGFGGKQHAGWLANCATLEISVRSAFQEL